MKSQQKMEIKSIRQLMMSSAAVFVVLSLVGPGVDSAGSPSPAPSPRSSPAPAPTVISLSGKLLYKSDGRWTLAVNSTSFYQLPGQPVEATGQGIPSGVSVSLNCTLAANETTVCADVTGARISRPSAPVRTTGLSLRLLVMVLSLTGSCTRNGAQLSAVQQAYNSPLGYANFLRNCSYGKVVYQSVTVISTPIACSSTITQRCDEDAMASAARAKAEQMNGAGYLDRFTHYTYVIPDGLVNTCGWVGLAELPGTQTWYTPDNKGIYSKGTVLQESVHNLNIYHGWKNGVEYEDYSTSMGSGDSCPSAPELWRLGWASVIDQLNSSTFASRVFRTYDLPATYLGPDRAMLKIQPNWMGTSYTKNVYLALRVKMGGDRDLLDEFDRKVNVHQLEKSIDNSFQAAGDPKITIIGTISPSSTLELTAYKLIIRTESLLESNTKIRVKVCRYDSSRNECQDTGLPPPAPRPLPPQSVRRPPSPQPPRQNASPPSPQPPRQNPLPPSPQPPRQNASPPSPQLRSSPPRRPPPRRSPPPSPWQDDTPPPY